MTTTTTATIRHAGLLAALTNLTEAKTLVAQHQCSDHPAWAAIDTAYAAVRKLERAAARKVQAEAKAAQGKNAPQAPAPVDNTPTPAAAQDVAKPEVVQSSKASPDGSLPKPTDTVDVAGLPQSQRPGNPKPAKVDEYAVLMAMWTDKGLSLPMGHPKTAKGLIKHAITHFGEDAVKAALTTTVAPVPEHKPTDKCGRYEGKAGMARLRADARATLGAGEKLPKNATKGQLEALVTAYKDRQNVANQANLDAAVGASFPSVAAQNATPTAPKLTLPTKPTTAERFASLPTDVQEMCLALCEQEMAARGRRAA